MDVLIRGPLPRRVAVPDGGDLWPLTEVDYLNALTIADWGLPAGLNLIGVSLDATRPPTIALNPLVDPKMGIIFVKVKLVATATGQAEAGIPGGAHSITGYEYYLVPFAAYLRNVATGEALPIYLDNYSGFFDAVDTTTYDVVFSCSVGKYSV